MVSKHFIYLIEEIEVYNKYLQKDGIDTQLKIQLDTSVDGRYFASVTDSDNFAWAFSISGDISILFESLYNDFVDYLKQDEYYLENKKEECNEEN